MSKCAQLRSKLIDLFATSLQVSLFSHKFRVLAMMIALALAVMSFQIMVSFILVLMLCNG